MQYRLIKIGTGLLMALLWGCGGGNGASHLESGLAAWEAGDFEEARNALAKAVQTSPDHPRLGEMYNLLGAAHWRMADNDRALKAFQQARRIQADSYDANYNLGVAYCRRGDVMQGATFLMEAAELQVGDVQALSYLGSAALKAGHAEEALEAFDNALLRSEADPALLTGRAVALIELGREEEGKLGLEEVGRLHAHYAPAAYHLAALEAEKGSPEEAKRLYEKYLLGAVEGERTSRARDRIAALDERIRGGSESSGTPTGPDGGEPPEVEKDPYEIQIEHALAAMKAGDEALTLNYCLQAARIADRAGDRGRQEKAFRSAVGWASRQPRAHFAYARYLRENGRAGEALRYMGKAAALKPDWEMAHVARVDIASQIGEPEVVRNALTDWIAALPVAAEPRWKLIEWERAHGSKTSRIAALEAFLDKAPSDPRCGAAQTELTRLKPPPPPPVAPPPVDDPPAPPPASTNTVDTTREETPKADPTRPPPHTLRAMTLFNEGVEPLAKKDYDTALRLYRKAVAEDPTYAPPYYNMGFIFHTLKRYQEAAEQYRLAAAVATGDTHVKARYHLGLVYQGMKDSDAAIKTLADLVSDHPDHASAHYLLGRLLQDRPGQVATARTHYEQYVRLAPNGDKAGEVRQWLITH